MRAVPGVPRPPDLFVATPEGRVALRVSAGRGTPVLLLHGLGRDGADFIAQLDGPLGRRHRLIAPDLPGHGASDAFGDPARRASLPGFADAVLAALEALDVDDVVVVGTSFGGHVGLELMTCCPGVLGAMLLGAPPLGHGASALARCLRPPGAPRPGLRPDADARFAHGVWGDVLEAAAGRRDPGDVARLGAMPAAFLRSLMEDRHADQVALVAATDVPLAVVAPDDDPLVDPAFLEAVPHAHLWGGARIAVPGRSLAARFLADMDRRRQHRADHPMVSYSW